MVVEAAALAIRLPRGYSVVVESSVRQATRGAIILGHNGQTNGINVIQFVCPSRTPIRAGAVWRKEKRGGRDGCAPYLARWHDIDAAVRKKMR